MRFTEQYINPKVLKIDHHYGQYERWRLLASYHKYFLKQSVKLGEIKSGMSVLDYGCGKQMLRHALPSDVEYTGYDIIPEFSDVENIRGRKYDVIFAIQVIHYINNTGIKELAKVFAHITNRLVVMVPTQTMFKRFLDIMLGQKKDNETFLSEQKEIYRILNDHFRYDKFKPFFGLAEVSRWRRM